MASWNVKVQGFWGGPRSFVHFSVLAKLDWVGVIVKFYEWTQTKYGLILEKTCHFHFV